MKRHYFAMITIVPYDSQVVAHLKLAGNRHLIATPSDDKRKKLRTSQRHCVAFNDNGLEAQQSRV